MDNLFKIVREAGIIALSEQKKMKISEKSDLSIVTNGDLAVSIFLERELKKIYPNHDIFSEENTGTIPNSKKVIIIDPIDGTESYSRNEDTWSILIGFLDNMIPVGGVVYQPTADTLYYGFKEQGSFKVSGSVKTKLDAQGVGSIKGIQSFKDYGENEFLNSLGINEIKKMYSAALKIMKVAEGESDAYPNFGKKCSLWDLVAPTIILEEAGGKVSYFDEISPSFESPRIDSRFCATGKRLYQKQTNSCSLGKPI